MVKLVIFNELSNARNPNNMQVLHTVLQHSPEQAPKVRSSPGETAHPQGLILPHGQTDGDGAKQFAVVELPPWKGSSSISC